MNENFSINVIPDSFKQEVHELHGKINISRNVLIRELQVVRAVADGNGARQKRGCRK